MGQPTRCVVTLYVGEGPRGSNGACSTLLAFSHSLHYPQSNWALLVLLPSGWACVHSRLLWASPMNSPVRLGVLLTPQTSQVFSVRGFQALFSHAGTLGCEVCLHQCSASWLSAHKCGTAQPPAASSPGPPAAALPPVLSALLPSSAPPTGLDELSSLSPWVSDFHTV